MHAQEPLWPISVFSGSCSPLSHTRGPFQVETPDAKDNASIDSIAILQLWYSGIRGHGGLVLCGRSTRACWRTAWAPVGQFATHTGKPFGSHKPRHGARLIVCRAAAPNWGSLMNAGLPVVCGSSSCVASAWRTLGSRSGIVPSLDPLRAFFSRKLRFPPRLENVS